MNKKKTLLIVLAMVLVCALSVMGTMALLAEGSNGVTNTFVASSTPDDFIDSIKLKEYGVTPDGKGGYTIAATAGETGNNYNVLPGVTLPKKAFVELVRTNEAPAYLFIEVVGELNSDIYEYSIDSKWVELTGVAGPNEGKVYVLGTKDGETVTGTVLGAVAASEAYTILTGDKITVKDNASLTSDSVSLEFYAYVAQATVAKADGENTSVPAEVFDTCF